MKFGQKAETVATKRQSRSAKRSRVGKEARLEPSGVAEKMSFACSHGR